MKRNNIPGGNMNDNRVSSLMLERYRLGEVTPDEQQIITEALSSDSALRSRLESLDASDRELRQRYPIEFMGLDNLKQPERPFRRRAAGNRIRFLGRLAALILVCILLPVIYLLRSNTGTGPTDRVKGLINTNSELSIYLMGDQESPLPDQTVLREGNTVQLAYTAPDGEYYGVIFSIDGRQTVTMHYPYRRGQSSLLVSGRHTFLSEAYTLDDAPDYEVFVMVVSGKPLNAETVLGEAQKIARAEAGKNADHGSAKLKVIEERSRAVFKDCEVEIITILKQ